MPGLRATAAGLALSLATLAPAVAESTLRLNVAATPLAAPLTEPGSGRRVATPAVPATPLGIARNLAAERRSPTTTAELPPPQLFAVPATFGSGAPLDSAGTLRVERPSPGLTAQLPHIAPTPGSAPAALTEAPADPLPSWRDGPTKQALLRFVREAGQPGGSGSIPPEERLAVFDNDGTLWSEQPLYFPFQFCVDQIRGLKAVPPAWRRQEPYASALRGDTKALVAQGAAALGTLLQACASGMDTETYDAAVRRWLATARHPISGRPYTAMVFQPMLELLRYLRAAGFRTYIVSGGETEFIRPWTAAVYGVPPEQVIGSRMALVWQQQPGQPPRLLRQPGVELVVDGPNKPIVIQHVLGRRPVAAFGNSDGDLQMLEWTTAGSGPRLALLVHHTDARREWAYDRNSAIGRLDKALDRARERGWLVVDMARDWLQVYPPQPPSP